MSLQYEQSWLHTRVCVCTHMHVKSLQWFQNSIVGRGCPFLLANLVYPQQYIGHQKIGLTEPVVGGPGCCVNPPGQDQKELDFQND